MTTLNAYAAASATSELKPMIITRREVTDTDIQISILYCGVCHSDIHMTRDEWGFNSIYPMVPGHEIVGRVINTGSKVTKYKVGDLVGVGCMVDSCRTCASCADNLEQYCENGSTMTYGDKDIKHGGVTAGGYSQQVVVDQDFVVRVPENLDIKAVAPLLCAGITTWSPLKKWNVSKGQKVGIIGLGGLGHMGVKFAHALGAHVVMITSSKEKSNDAHKLGADEILISKDADAMSKHANSFDFILNTIPVGHDVNPYIDLLKRDATMVIVGSLNTLDGINGGKLIIGRKNVAGSLIGGIKETQEMLDFCGKHNIVSDIEVIKIQTINEAYARMIKSDVKYRFVIDMQSLGV